MLSIIDAMNETKGFVRPMREGEELLNSGMVISVGKKGKVGDVVHVQALVLRTSGLQSKDPAVVEMWVDVSKDYGKRMLKDNEEEFKKHCDCPAGNSEKCKHVVAVMLCLASLDELELDDLSCTDTEKQWGALKSSTLKEYEAKPLSNLCHVKGQRDIYAQNMPPITKEMQDRWREKLMNCTPLGEYSMFTSCVRMGQGLPVCEEDAVSRKLEKMSLLRKLLTFRTWNALGKVRKMTIEKVEKLEPELKDFYERHVSVTLEQSVFICAAEQGSPQWKQARKVRQTASKARAQFTYLVNKKANWDARYAEVFNSTWTGNEETARGLLDEVSCREKYEEKNMCTVLESGLLVRPEIPWLAASLDGTVLDPSSNLVRNIEVKSFKAGTRLSCSELLEMEAIPTIDVNGNLKEKTQHYAQVQLGMLVSGLDQCDYCVWSQVEEDFVTFRILFDEKHVLDLCSRLVIVYFDKFLPRMYANDFSNVIDGGDDDDEDGD